MFSPFLHGALRERPRRAVWLPRWGVARYVTLIFRLASVANHHGHVSFRLWRSAGEYPFTFFSTSSTRHPLFPRNSSLHPQISRPAALGVLLRAFPSAVAAARPLSLSDLRPTAVYQWAVSVGEPRRQALTSLRALLGRWRHGRTCCPWWANVSTRLFREGVNSGLSPLGGVEPVARGKRDCAE